MNTYLLAISASQLMVLHITQPADKYNIVAPINNDIARRSIDVTVLPLLTSCKGTYRAAMYCRFGFI